MNIKSLAKIIHPDVLRVLASHPPRLINCEICGGTRVQVQTAPAPEIGARCIFCGGTGRHRSAFATIRDLFGNGLERLRGGAVYETSAHGALIHALRRFSATVPFDLVCSEFLDCKLGDYLDGVRCEDLERLTFTDSSFDLITSTDVMEHVENDVGAFREVARVLKPGGYYVFTIPFFPAQTTIVRAVRDEDGTIRHLHQPEYHSDPWRTKGVFTWRNYGSDITERMECAGLLGEVRVVRVSGTSTPMHVMVAHRP